MQIKIDTPIDKLCAGLPTEFATYLAYTRGLRFEEEPDYNYCRHLFQEAMRTHGYTFDLAFDWIEEEESDAVSFG
jgi:hypothetical protein